MKEMKLSNSDQVTLVDDDIWLQLCHYKWRLKKSGACSYVVRSGSICHWVGGKRKRKNITIQLHRVVMNCPDGKEVHHIDGNPLDNRRVGLEIVDPKQHKIESGYKRGKNEKGIGQAEGQ